MNVGGALTQKEQIMKERQMHKPLRLSILAAVLAASALVLVGSSASATTNFANAPSGAHYAKGSSEPVCTISGLTVTCTATSIQGVGNTNAELSLAVTTTFSGVCHNPGTNSMVVEPFSRSETNTTTAELTPSRNGRLAVPEESASGPDPADFTCPNPNWTPEVTSAVTSFVYSLTFVGFDDPVIFITG
jgi:hypothetical protein